MLNVMWHAQKDSRGYYNSTAMLNEALDKFTCMHHFCSERFPKDVDGGVVIVHGGREIGHVGRLNIDLDTLKWAIVIYLGDEECSFPIEDVVLRPNMIEWIQEPLPGRHDRMKRRMICGYGHRHDSYFPAGKPDRDLEWFFGGQVTHSRRRACVDALRTMDWGGIIIETKGYHQGVSLEEYYRTLWRAQIVPCPSGVMSPDAARPWDALECGAIPILDDLSPARSTPGFWEYVLGDHPLPVITDWSELPRRIESMKRQNTKLLQREATVWWTDYRWKFLNRWLAEDLKELGIKV
jgi:hypothetical protein